MSSGTINLDATYAYLEKHGHPKGTLWTEKIMRDAGDLEYKVQKLNELHAEKEAPISKRLIDNLKTELGDFVPGNPYEVPTVSGKSKTLKIPEYDPEMPRLTSVMHGIVEISRSFKTNGEPDEDISHARLFELKTRKFTKHEDEFDCLHEDPPWPLWEHSWDTGDCKLPNGKCWGRIVDASGVTWGYQEFDELKDTEKEDKRKLASLWKGLSVQLNNFVKNHKRAFENVDKVICFGLGPLSIERAKSFIQHKAAATIANALTELRKSPVKVYAQDPAYCSYCSEILRNRLNIETTTSFDDFFKIDKNTVVVTFAPTGPICPIIADLTREFGGPAAMLCDEINSDYMKPQSEIDNEPTKNLVAYTKKCSFEKFGDRKELYAPLKMTHEEFFKKYPDPPTKGNFKEHPEKDPGIWKRGYSLDTQSCFTDSGFYVLEEPQS